jgi:hypothetical protein
VDSFFDITYRIDFVGAPGGQLAGMSGSTTGTIRMRAGGGGCQHTPVSCDDQNPCTVDSCDPASGVCEYAPIPTSEVGTIGFSNQTTMGWSPTPDASHWNTYRGTIPSNHMGSRPPGAQYDHTCFESDDANGDGPTTATDAGIPPVGQGFYYNTTGENGCFESDIGHASSGATIPNTSPCPTPP